MLIQKLKKNFKPMRLVSSLTDPSDLDSGGFFTNEDISVPKYPEINLKKKQ